MENMSNSYRTSIEEIPTVCRTTIGNLGGAYGTTIEDRPNTDVTSIEPSSTIYRTCIQALSNIYRRSIGHRSNTHRTAIQNVPVIDRTHIDQLSTTHMSNIHRGIFEASFEHLPNSYQASLGIHRHPIEHTSQFDSPCIEYRSNDRTSIEPAANSYRAYGEQLSNIQGTTIGQLSNRTYFERRSGIYRTSADERTYIETVVEQLSSTCGATTAQLTDVEQLSHTRQTSTEHPSNIDEPAVKHMSVTHRTSNAQRLSIDRTPAEPLSNIGWTHIELRLNLHRHLLNIYRQTFEHRWASAKHQRTSRT